MLPVCQSVTRAHSHACKTSTTIALTIVVADMQVPVWYTDHQLAMLFSVIHISPYTLVIRVHF
jgi:hypothetical protein